MVQGMLDPVSGRETAVPMPWLISSAPAPRAQGSADLQPQKVFNEQSEPADSFH